MKPPHSLHRLHSGGSHRGFGFGPYIRLGGPTYGFVHVFHTWFWMRWFSVHGFGHNGFWSMVLDASTCINMYCNIKRNIMKNQVGSPSFGIEGKISVYMCFMFYALELFIFYVLEFYAGNCYIGLKPKFGIRVVFGFNWMPLLLRGFVHVCGRTYSVRHL